MENTQILHSRRILFKKFTEEDKNKELDIFNHKNLKYFTEKNIENPSDFINQTIKSYVEKKDFHFWHLVKIGEDESLGMAKVDLKDDTAWIKVLIKDSIKNRGYGTEALEALIHEVFTENLAIRIMVKAQKENAPWQEVIKKSHLHSIKEDDEFIYYQMTNIDYMKYFAIFGEINI